MIINTWQRYNNALRHYRKMNRFPLVQEGVVYHCPLDDAKRRNLARQAVNKKLLFWKEIARPHIIHVGVTTHCNLSCPACALWEPETLGVRSCTLITSCTAAWWMN